MSNLLKDMPDDGIVYEIGRFNVRRAKNGFELCEDGITHATLRGSYGPSFLEDAKARARYLFQLRHIS